MFHQRPGRARGFPYIGCQQYFLTICTANRRPVFAHGAEVEWMLALLRSIMGEEKFALPAWCFMPDHVHLLLEATSDDSDLGHVVPRWKQVCGYRYRRRSGGALWQPGYYDRILRNEESLLVVARYILENPVRAGLATSLGEYPFAGSDVWSMTELSEAFQMQHFP